MLIWTNSLPVRKHLEHVFPKGILTFSYSYAVVDGDELFLSPCPACQCAVVACGCVAIQQTVIWNDNPTPVVGLFKYQGPCRCEHFTVIGWRAQTGCIIAVQPKQIKRLRLDMWRHAFPSVRWSQVKVRQFEVLSSEAKASWCPLIGWLIKPEAVVDVASSEKTEISLFLGWGGTCNHTEGCYIHQGMEK